MRAIGTATLRLQHKKVSWLPTASGPAGLLIRRAPSRPCVPGCSLGGEDEAGGADPGSARRGPARHGADHGRVRAAVLDNFPRPQGGDLEARALNPPKHAQAGGPRPYAPPEVWAFFGACSA